MPVVATQHTEVNIELWQARPRLSDTALGIANRDLDADAREAADSPVASAEANCAENSKRTKQKDKDPEALRHITALVDSGLGMLR